MSIQSDPALLESANTNSNVSSALPEPGSSGSTGATNGAGEATASVSSDSSLALAKSSEPKALSSTNENSSSSTAPHTAILKESIALRRARIEQTRREANRLMLQAAQSTAGSSDAAEGRNSSDDRTEGNEEFSKASLESENLSSRAARPAVYQIAQSSKRINQLLFAGNQVVDGLKAKIVTRQSSQRQQADETFEQFYKARADSELESSKINEKIERGWKTVLDEKFAGNPYALKQLLDSQRSASKLLVESKTKVLAEFEKELESRDEQYIKELKKQAEEMDTLLDQLQGQFTTMQRAYKQELSEIERAHMIERGQILESNNKELEAMAIQRQQYEQRALNDAHDRYDKNRQQLDQIYITDAEDYNLVKLKLETDVRVLEQQLQQTRATYQLNIEKLEYNFQVLKKREEENGSILTNHKRKINRQADVANTLKAKLDKQHKQFNVEFATVQEEHKRIVQQINDMKSKHRELRLKDQRNYGDIWRMNEETAKDYMRQIMQADRYISEKILALPYEPPLQVKLLAQSVDPMLSTAQDIENFKRLVDSVVAPRKATDQHDSAQFQQEPQQSSEAGSLAGISNDTAESVEGVEGNSLAHTNESQLVSGNSAESLASFIQNSKMYNDTVKVFFQYLCDEASFLIEDKLHKLLQPLRPEEQRLMKLDSIFKALNVTTTGQVQHLLKYFIRKPDSSSGKESEAVIQLIHPNEILRAVRRFLESRRGASSETLSTVTESGEFIDESDPEDDESISGIEGETVSAILDANARTAALAAAEAKKAKKRVSEQRSLVRLKYWEVIGDVIGEGKTKVWSNLARSLESYNHTLKERSDLADEVQSISQQNQELKHLLRQYMAATVNDDLCIPPTQVLLAKAGMASGGDTETPLQKQQELKKTLGKQDKKTTPTKVPMPSVQKIEPRQALPLPTARSLAN